MSDPNFSGITRRRFAQLAAGSAFGLGTAGASIATALRSPAFEAFRGKPVSVGCLVYERMDQIDLTGPFSVLSRLPDATVTLVGLARGPIHDHKGFAITPQASIGDSPTFDVLLVPGGPGQEAVMDDDAVLSLVRKHSDSARPVFSVCTGALICGAAGILRGRRATTHWSAIDLLGAFGATAVKERVVIDGNVVSAAGVTAGIDGALVVAGLLRSESVAQQIQLDIQYAPEPPFHAGAPETAPPAVLAEVRQRYAPLVQARRATAARISAQLGLQTRR